MAQPVQGAFRWGRVLFRCPCVGRKALPQNILHDSYVKKAMVSLMFQDEKKLMRLTAVLKMYYEKEMSQQEIAKEIGVSRPMVSKMLAEAKSLNMVTITINELHNMQQMLRHRLAENFKVRQAIVIKSERGNAVKTQQDIARACYEICRNDKVPYHKVGIGCGSMIGQLSDIAMQAPDMLRVAPPAEYEGEIFPLIGGFKASYKSYHTNEMVRIFAEFTGLKASYMYLPALLDSSEEKELYKKTELYTEMQNRWENMNVALVNVSNLYSTPDLATSIRFGKQLKVQHAVGRLLAHYYDINGKFIEPEQDNILQVEQESLKKAKYVIGMCSDTTDVLSAVGALRTGVITHVIMTDTLAQGMLKYLDESAEK